VVNQNQPQRGMNSLVFLDQKKIQGSSSMISAPWFARS